MKKDKSIYEIQNNYEKYFKIKFHIFNNSSDV